MLKIQGTRLEESKERCVFPISLENQTNMPLLGIRSLAWRNPDQTLGPRVEADIPGLGASLSESKHGVHGCACWHLERNSFLKGIIQFQALSFDATNSSYHAISFGWHELPKRERERVSHLIPNSQRVSLERRKSSKI